MNSIVDELKTDFLHAMQFLYPQGVTHGQALDLLRTFSMGWYQGLKKAGDDRRCGLFLLDCGFLKDQTWKPDASWLWWLKPHSAFER